MSFIAGYILGLEEGGSYDIISAVRALPQCATGIITDGWTYELHYGAMPHERPWVLMDAPDGSARVMTMDQPMRLWAVILHGGTAAECTCLGIFSGPNACIRRRLRTYSEGRLWWREYYDLHSFSAAVSINGVGSGGVTFTMSVGIEVVMHHVRYTDYTHSQAGLDEYTTWTGAIARYFPSSSTEQRYSELSEEEYLTAMEELGTAVM